MNTDFIGKCISKRTRSNTKHRVLHTHRQTSELHIAITTRNKRDVKRLLASGERLCTHAGLNCFVVSQSTCSWSFVSFLLKLDDSGVRAKTYEEETLLMLYAFAHNIPAITELLKLGANPNDRSKDGSTALMLAVKKANKCSLYIERSKELLEILLNAGADASLCTFTTNENVLHFAVKNFSTFNVDALKSLVEAGADPTVEDNEGCTVLSAAMMTFCESFYRHDSLHTYTIPAIVYLLSLPQFNSETFKFICRNDMHPQTILLENLIISSICFAGDFSNFTDLFHKYKFLLDPELVVYRNIRNLFSGDVPLGPLGVLLHSFRYPSLRYWRVVQSSRELDLKKILEALVSCGFIFSLPSYVTISTLTVFLNRLHHFNRDYFTQNFAEITKYMIEHRAPVEQRILSNDYLFPWQKGNELRSKIVLPDSLLLAVTNYSDNYLSKGELVEIVTQLLPYFPPPPLALLTFVPTHLCSTLFPVLSAGGQLHNSPLHIKLRKHIIKWHLPDEEMKLTFDNMHSSPPLLQELCRTTVRMCIASKASETRHTLPELIKSLELLAPKLKIYLLMNTP